MPAAPKKKPKLTALSRAATKLVVWLGPDDGSPPSAIHQVDYLKPMKIERVAGGSRMNTATFQYDLGLNDEHVLDTLTPQAINRQIEVREIDLHGKTKRILFWGKLATQPVEIGDKESVQYVARIDRHMFGDPLGKIPFWWGTPGGTPGIGAVTALDRPLVFNPEVDETVKANKSDKLWTDRDSCSVFFDAEQIDTAAARAAHQQTPAKWYLYEAVHTLIWLCNPNETFITNPNITDCFTALQAVDASHEYLKNLSLDAGKFLPELLDNLLNPYGCSWTIDIEEDATTGETVRKFRFFRRNEGTQKELFLQRPGEKLDPVKSTVAQLGLTFDIVSLSNKIIGCTSLRQREGTFELKKGWKVSEDGTTKENFEQNSTTAKDRPHAIRKWVLNDNGAWNGLRPEITQAYDLSDLFGEPTMPTCRKFLPCLSRVSDPASSKLESRGIFVEWLDPEDSTWKKVKWSWSNLNLECGIYFESFPQELWDALQDDPATARLRVTATITGDTKRYATAVRDESSPNADDVTLRLNLGNKFHDRALHSSSIFIGDSATADIVDDTINLQAYVETVRGLEDSAELSVSAALEGIDHPEYQIGNLITKVNGRNLSLIRNNATAGVADRYIQVMGLIYIPQNPQKTELLLESFDEEQAL